MKARKSKIHETGSLVAINIAAHWSRAILLNGGPLDLSEPSSTKSRKSRSQSVQNGGKRPKKSDCIRKARPVTIQNLFPLRNFNPEMVSICHKVVYYYWFKTTINVVKSLRDFLFILFMVTNTTNCISNNFNVMSKCLEIFILKL